MIITLKAYTLGAEQKVHGNKVLCLEVIRARTPIEDCVPVSCSQPPHGLLGNEFVSQACQLDVHNVGIHLLLTRTSARKVHAAICCRDTFFAQQMPKLHNIKVFTYVKSHFKTNIFLRHIPSPMVFPPSNFHTTPIEGIELQQ